jgi:hypothetical protein
MSLRGRRSRNKVSVGEPADGSLTQILLNVTGVLGVWGEYLFSPPPSTFYLPIYYGSHIDEERSEMRYAMRIAEFRESSDL